MEDGILEGETQVTREKRTINPGEVALLARLTIADRILNSIAGGIGYKQLADATNSKPHSESADECLDKTAKELKALSSILKDIEDGRPVPLASTGIGVRFDLDTRIKEMDAERTSNLL